MPDMDLKKIILVAAFIAVAVVVFLVKEAINKKKGESGEDLAKVRQVIDKLLPGSGSYTTAYATYMSDQSVGNRISKYYYHYAIAFKPGSLFVVPIKYSGGEISFQGSGTMLTKDNLGKLKPKGDSCAFFDKSGKELCTFCVYASNTRQDKYQPFNIQQKEQAEAYEEFLKDLISQVNG